MQSPTSDTRALEAQIRAIIAANAGQPEQYKSGKTKVGCFVGQVYACDQGRGRPAVV
ncbi:MAG: hypothetical protein IPH72_30830 [Sandaracinaceae bacterium]|nr:hypothetical protein [Sandaracinaceae bacterium]